jgi:PAS domain S-box-containing protein
MLVQGVLDYAIYMISPEGIVTNWNSGAARIKGYAASEVVGSHFSRFYTQRDRDLGLPVKGKRDLNHTAGHASAGMAERIG